MLFATTQTSAQGQWRRYDDVDLANSPVVVIGCLADQQLYRQVRNQRLYTFDDKPFDLMVAKVIHGQIGSGRITVLAYGGISFGSNGTITDFVPNSLVMGGNAFQTGIWFLTPGRSKDPKDRRLYLRFDSWREVQPLNLLPFYEALRRQDRDTAVGEFLGSEDPDLVGHALGYLSGSCRPWPFETFGGRALPDEQHSVLLRRYLPRMQDLIVRMPSTCRAVAAALYAAVAGKASVPLLRDLLSDNSSEVRLIATGYLTRFGDVDSMPRFAVACRQADSYALTCNVIDEMSRIGDIRFVPALIEFLGITAHNMQSGDDYYIPAIRARAALKRLTGYAFPEDAASSAKAWYAVRVQAAPTRRKRLKDLLGDWDNPLSVTIVPLSNPETKKLSGPRYQAHVRVTNRARRNLTVFRRPEGISEYVESPEGGSQSEALVLDGAPGTQVLGPRRSIEYRISTGQNIFRRGVHCRLVFQYVSQSEPTKAWTDVVELSLVDGRITK